MESLFNLLWLALSSVLLTLWLHGQRQWSDELPRPSRRMQFVTVAMLIFILLPVVSLSDDLQACAPQAESEHLVRLGDSSDHGSLLPVISIALAATLLFSLAYRRSLAGSLAVPQSTVHVHMGYRRILGNLPPPQAAFQQF